MTPKVIKSRPPPRRAATSSYREALGAYLADPGSFPKDLVVRSDDDFVWLRDRYPKALVHLLILPRDSTKNRLSPQQAFGDPVFFAACRQQEQLARSFAATELRDMLMTYSAMEKARKAAEGQSGSSGESLPPTRDWDGQILSGVHAEPSMAHLHIHVLSREMYSPKMRKSEHYLSFTTDFLIGLEEFPLAEEDHLRRCERVKGNLVCWRCGKEFGRAFARLKRHLEEEFLEWRAQ